MNAAGRRFFAHATALAVVLAAVPYGAGAQAAGDDARETGRAAASDLRVTFLHTSDEHSALLPAPLIEYRHGDPERARGGFARLAYAVEQERVRKAEAGEPVVLSSAGDHTGGTPYGWLVLDGEAPELMLMAAAGYDVITIGNHEFDYGPDVFAGTLAAAGLHDRSRRTTIVATNTRPPDGHALTQRGVQRTHVAVLPNGLRIGFIGLIGEGAARVAPLAPPVRFDDAREAAAAAESELRAAGAHIVVAVTHSGLVEDRALARAVPGIDIILGGHDHRLLDEPVTEGQTVIVHPGAYLRQFARLEVGYDAASGAVRVRNEETGSPYVQPLDHTVPEHPRLAALIDAYTAQVEQRIAGLTGGALSALDAPAVRAGFPLRRARRAESGLGNFVTDAMRAAAEAATGERVDVVFQANGVIRADVVPGQSAATRDVITVHDLIGTVGMGSGPDGAPGYPLVSVWLTADELRRALEVSVLLSELMGDSYFLQVSGLRARYDPRRAVLARIPVRGTPIPSGRAVLSLARETADEASIELVSLDRGDDRLHHVVTDRYVASFLPLVGRIVPRLDIIPKDRSGAAIEDLDDAILRRDGQELKVWQAVLEFAAAQPRDADGHARVPAYYAQPAGRLIEERARPLWVWPAAGLVLLLGLVGVGVWRWRS